MSNKTHYLSNMLPFKVTSDDDSVDVNNDGLIIQSETLSVGPMSGS